MVIFGIVVEEVNLRMCRGAKLFLNSEVSQWKDDIYFDTTPEQKDVGEFFSFFYF